ncbi:MAG: hypothetical protein ACOZE7_10130 [Pseudomonadota bacterium]
MWVMRTGVSAGMYLATIALQCWAVDAGLLSRTVATWLIVYQVIGFSLLYGLLRSGLSLRLPDPSMAFWQSMLGLSVVVLNYALFEASRNVGMPLLCLTLVFGLYVLSPAQILLAGGCAVAMLLAMLFFVSRLHLPDFDVEQGRAQAGRHRYRCQRLLPGRGALLGDRRRPARRLQGRGSGLRQGGEGRPVGAVGRGAFRLRAARARAQCPDRQDQSEVRGRRIGHDQ